jgi:hypothetical protein
MGSGAGAQFISRKAVKLGYTNFDVFRALSLLLQARAEQGVLDWHVMLSWRITHV